MTDRPAGGASLSFALVAVALAALSAGAVWYVFIHGWTLFYGDAEAHFNLARRVLDSQTPGYDQLGTPWLPLPHVVLLPFVRVDAWWHSGIAAAIPSAVCYVIGCLFLFASVRRIFDSTAAAMAATALAALNPNLLYLQSTSMTEPVFFAALMALLYCTLRGWAVGAGLASCAASLTRYDGWFLIPFVALFFVRTDLRKAVLFGVVASAAPLYWVAHNWYLTGDPLYFVRGPGSPRAIQGDQPYPGKEDWRLTWLYYSTAVRLCAGPGLWLMTLAGTVVALARRAVWPVLLLALPGVFYLWSMHSSGGTPIHLPMLWPHSYYNTRYGLAALPLLAFASAALVMAVPVPVRAWVAMLVIVAGTVHWAVHHQPDDWITWAESNHNSAGRLAWTHEAADFLRPQYVPGSGIFSSGGTDFLGIYRVMGIPLRETFSIDNGLTWEAAVRRPDLFVWQEWAVAKRGDPVALAAQRLHYRLELTITKEYEPVIEIYRRTGGHENSLYEGARRQE